MLQEKSGCYLFLGNVGEFYGCSTHNAHYDFNDQILPIWAQYLMKLVEHYLEKIVENDEKCHELNKFHGIGFDD